MASRKAGWENVSKQGAEERVHRERWCCVLFDGDYEAVSPHSLSVGLPEYDLQQYRSIRTVNLFPVICILKSEIRRNLHSALLTLRNE
ncbi:hypothetical protein MPTK1_6g18260 [Marchantia polymorpha subsp. ruderalis]|uniref:Uncharacterized protein n=2 Tax=Marchantia polymorpha TaxID=3197 RepID=A0AAF6BTB4_MARPO|nr:hypothetical protein MARPO_0038s0035 [Marchantia polymorpha]BBN15248.1 hypothetical protein Mp_6g18260 [Marchantia polymorpha subsp. ruderalis]|eukprot:PTQ40680.1 hypothetical protein MARPO_0038s0035 [Marchantia polymorpha]